MSSPVTSGLYSVLNRFQYFNYLLSVSEVESKQRNLSFGTILSVLY